MINYNPEGSLLRRDQKELLSMLEVLAEICKKNNIQWWLCSGTLLGAARHQGFIPWDDDIDIVLLKKDYKRLEKILCSMDSNEFVFHCMKTDVEYVNWFGKFRKREGCVKSASKRYNYYKWKGIGLDIFAIEKTNYLTAKLATLSYNIMQRKTGKIQNNFVRKSLIRSIEYLHSFIIFPILKLISIVNPNEEYHFTLGSGWYSAKFYKKDIFPLSTAIFENKPMPVPRDIDACLTNEFGDWRKMPSEEQIKKSIHCQEYRDEIFGKGE